MKTIVDPDAAKLRELLVRNNLTQAAFAEKFGIPLRTIENWCTGTRKATEYIIGMIEKIFNLERKIEMKNGRIVYIPIIDREGSTADPEYGAYDTEAEARNVIDNTLAHLTKREREKVSRCWIECRKYEYDEDGDLIPECLTDDSYIISQTEVE